MQNCLSWSSSKILSAYSISPMPISNCRDSFGSYTEDVGDWPRTDIGSFNSLNPKTGFYLWKAVQSYHSAVCVHSQIAGSQILETSWRLSRSVLEIIVWIILHYEYVILLAYSVNLFFSLLSLSSAFISLLCLKSNIAIERRNMILCIMTQEWEKDPHIGHNMWAKP